MINSQPQGRTNNEMRSAIKAILSLFNLTPIKYDRLMECDFENINQIQPQADHITDIFGKFADPDFNSYSELEASIISGTFAPFPIHNNNHVHIKKIHSLYHNPVIPNNDFNKQLVNISDALLSDARLIDSRDTNFDVVKSLSSYIFGIEPMQSFMHATINNHFASSTTKLARLFDDAIDTIKGVVSADIIDKSLPEASTNLTPECDYSSDRLNPGDVSVGHKHHNP